MERRLPHIFAFALKQNRRHIVLANLAAGAIELIMNIAAEIVFRDADRLGAQCANALCVFTARIAARSRGPTNGRHQFRV